MAALQCEICGGKLMGRPGGIFECESCGMQYDTAWAKAKVQEIKGTVKVEGPVEVKGAVKVEGPVEVKGGASAENYVKRGRLAMEVHHWADATIYFDRALNINAECAEAHLGKFCAHFNNADIHQLIGRFGAECLQYADFHSALRFMDPADATKLREEVNRAEQIIQEQKRKKAQEEEAKRIAKEKEKEAKRIAREEARKKEIEQATAKRVRIQKATGLIAAGCQHTVALKSDGTVVATGYNSSGQCNVGAWRDIVALSAGPVHTVGLKTDGTVVATGTADGRCNVGNWREITAISAGGCHTVGLKKDGTVVATGDNSEGQCNVADWRDVVAVAAGDMHTVGLKADGTVIAAGDNSKGQCKVKRWRNIVAISAGEEHTVGLKANGDAIAAGGEGDEYDEYYGQCDVDTWEDIVSVSAGAYHTVGLQSDGTVITEGGSGSGYDIVDYETDVKEWSQIVAVCAGAYHTVALREDGTVVAAGISGNGKSYRQCDVGNWKLFQNFDNLEQERTEERAKTRIQQNKQDENLRVIQHRRNVGRCQHCGGEFKGLFSKKCARCGKIKDY